MGTRSTTTFYDEWNDKPICMFYRQMDGYLAGHGRDLKDALQNIVITNGISARTDKIPTANGMGCLAAQAIEHCKHDAGIGGIYMVPLDNGPEEYNYHLYARFKDSKTEHRTNSNGGKDMHLWVTVKDDEGKVIYDGWLSKMPTKE